MNMHNPLFRYLFMHSCQLTFDDGKMQYCV
jgi:hypothetical protein